MKNGKYIKEILVFMILVSPIAWLLLKPGGAESLVSIQLGDSREGPKILNKSSFIMYYSVIVGFVYLVILGGNKFLFKRGTAESSQRKYMNFKLILSMLITLMSFYLVGDIEGIMSTRRIANLFICGLIVITCNFFPMMTAPNYFIGIRLPWTISNETVWIKTHRHIGHVWFVLGILCMILVMFLPEKSLKTFFWIFIISLLAHSIIYSAVVAVREQLIKTKGN